MIKTPIKYLSFDEMLIDAEEHAIAYNVLPSHAEQIIKAINAYDELKAVVKERFEYLNGFCGSYEEFQEMERLKKLLEKYNE